MNLKRLIGVALVGPRYAKLSQKNGDKRSLLTITKEIISFNRKYRLFPSQYISRGIGLLKGAERDECIRMLAQRADYLNKYDDNCCFLAKYSGFEWQTNTKMRLERNRAYIARYNMGKHCYIQYGVTFLFEHNLIGKVKIGDHVLFARNADIDITGDIDIRDGVSISEGVKILTHNHEFDYDADDMTKGCILTPLTIQDHVWVGARAIIMPGVREIGRGAIISSDSYVNAKVPPYAIVMGNPAKIVGFKLTPDEVREEEERHYPAEERTDLEQYEKVYNKYFIDRIKDIKKFVNL